MAKNSADADQAPAGPPVGEASPERRFWQYTGPERLYTHIPVTMRDGDVIEYNATDTGVALPPLPDGHWAAHDGPATVGPDNHPQLVDEVTPDA